MHTRGLRLVVAVGMAGVSLCLFLAVLGGSAGWVGTALAVDCNVSPGGSIQDKVSDPTCTTVIVAAGTYAENVVITRSIVLRGDDAATTIINGSGNGPVIRVAGGAPTIEKFTLTNGDASAHLGCGGGVSIVNAAATVRDNVIRDNVASSDGNVPGWGGGVCAMTGTATVHIYNNTIRNNAAISATATTQDLPGLGGGIGIWRRHSTVVISGNQVYSNIAVRMPATNAVWGIGGGIWCEADLATIQSNVVRDNVANGASGAASGGGLGTHFSAVTLTDNQVLNNLGVHTATDMSWGNFLNGGGVMLYGPPTATVRGNWIMTNTGAVYGQSTGSPQNVWAGGGGLSVSDIDSLANDRVVVENNHIIANTLVQTLTTSGPDSKAHAEGGGLRIERIANVIVSGNEVRGNTAARKMSITGNGGDDSEETGAQGGGVHISNSDVVTISDNVIADNISVERQTLVDAEATNWAGGLFFNSVGRASVQSNTISSNRVVDEGVITAASGERLRAYGGGVAATGECNLSFINNHILDNVSGYDLAGSGSDYRLRSRGGGMALEMNGPVVLRSNIVSGNLTSESASVGGGGGGLELWSGARVDMSRNLIVGNRAPTNPGGAIHAGDPATVVTSTNDIMARNSSGITVEECQATLVNDTLHDNADEAIRVEESGRAMISNTIVSGHVVGLHADGSATIIEDYNLLQNANNYQGAVTTGTHTIVNQDPKFVNAAADNFRLQASSPAVDSANAVWAPPIDFYGVARPQGPRPDIGAAEGTERRVHLPIIRKQQ